MNTPSTTGGNWQYRTVNGDFTPRLAKRIYRLNELYNRLPEKPAAQVKKLETPVSVAAEKRGRRASDKAKKTQIKLEKKEK